MLDRSQLLVGGVDYPRDWNDFITRFAGDEACADYLGALRWPQGFVCPACGGRRSWWLASGHHRCCACRRKTSVTAGTIFHRTHQPLRVWFAAIWYVANQRTGVSALGLQRALGLGSYETAWTMLHKLRRGMILPGRDVLSGQVEIDESFIGGVLASHSGRQRDSGKALIAIAIEVRGQALGRARLARIPDATAETLTAFVYHNVAPGTLVRTDGWKGYSRLVEHGYQHQPISLRALGEGRRAAHSELPHVHRVAALVKRWLLGTHQGAVRPEQLDYYLDEWTFRFNRRRSRHVGLIFRRLLEGVAQHPPAEYRQIAGGSLHRFTQI